MSAFSAKVEIRFKDGSKMVVSKNYWNTIRTYKWPIIILGRRINPLDIVGHDYFK